jgi:hypothetical protein
MEKKFWGMLGLEVLLIVLILGVGIATSCPNPYRYVATVADYELCQHKTAPEIYRALYQPQNTFLYVTVEDYDNCHMNAVDTRTNRIKPHGRDMKFWREGNDWYQNWKGQTKKANWDIQKLLTYCVNNSGK